ncbi:hypothetical protein [Hyphococcus sp.]|jgi:hypothetical protein|uniref:hypothetical protein n=1 Tax=Hyphococcus sp. TaxID=2038636 RepID=UPI003D106549
MTSHSIFSKAFSIAVAVSLVTSQASAEIHRGCSGWIESYSVAWVNKKGDHVKWGNGSPPPGELVAAIEGRGFCRGKSQADECRKDAKNAVVACGRWIWEHRWSATMAERIGGCVTAFSGSRAQGKIDDWARSDQPDVNLYGDIKRTVEYNSCCVQRPHAQDVWSTVSLRVSSTNSEVWNPQASCAYSTDFSEDYHSDCTALRAEGLCGAANIPPRRTNG